MPETAADSVLIAFEEIQPVEVPGLGLRGVMPSPEEVQSVNRLKLDAARVVVEFDPAEGRQSLHTLSYHMSDEDYTVGIAIGGVAFPERCAECGDEHTHYEILEAATGEGPALGRTEFPGLSDEEEGRVRTAISGDRTWYAVPFCATHTLGGRSVNFKEDKPGTLELTNRTYAEQLATQNKLRGQWFERSLVLLKYLSLILAVAGAGLVGGAGLAMLNPEPGNRGTGSGVAMIAIGVVLLAVSYVAYRRGRTGEPLTVA